MTGKRKLYLWKKYFIITTRLWSGLLLNWIFQQLWTCDCERTGTLQHNNRQWENKSKKELKRVSEQVHLCYLDRNLLLHCLCWSEPAALSERDRNTLKSKTPLAVPSGWYEACVVLMWIPPADPKPLRKAFWKQTTPVSNRPSEEIEVTYLTGLLSGSRPDVAPTADSVQCWSISPNTSWTVKI